MNFNFGEVLTRAWQIVWKHRALWIFGILASCGRGGSNYNFNNSGGGDGGFGDGAQDLPPQFERFLEWVAANVTTFVVLVITLACVISLIAIFLGTIGRIGLIRGAAQVEGGSESLIFGQLFSESTPYFWRIFGLSLLVGLPFVVIVGALAAALAFFAVSMSGGNDASAVGFIGILPVFAVCVCLMVPILWVIRLIVHQSERAIVLDDMPVVPSLSRGWEIFRVNLGPIILMAIILAVITAVVGFVIFIPVLVVAVPAIIAFAAGDGQNMSPLYLALACICLYAPVSWLLNGIANAYAESAWTLTYLRLTGKPPAAPSLEGTPPQSPDEGDRTVISVPNA